MLHSRESNLLRELDVRRKRGHVAQGSGCLSAGVGAVFARCLKLVFRTKSRDRIYFV
jgi:hypothetical protein